MARTQIKATVSKLPTAVPSSLGKESPAKFEEGVKEIKDILSTEQHELSSVGNQVEQYPRFCLELVSNSAAAPGPPAAAT